jgi:hypothetical protein
MTSKYDLVVAYRIYPSVSKANKPPIFSDNKYKLSELCLRSFKASLGSLKVRIFVLLDDCPIEYQRLFTSLFDPEDLELIQLTGIGNSPTFEMQIKLLLEQNYSDLVYFAEDDYLYMPFQFEKMVSFLNSFPDVDFISPYDHLSYYTTSLHDHPEVIRAAYGKHWRTTNSTCLTFLAKKESLKQAKSTLMTFISGSSDASLWVSLTKIHVFDIKSIFQYRKSDPWLYDIFKKSWIYNWRQILFGKKFTICVPIPSIATHMEQDYMAPNVDWMTLMKET